MSSFPEPVLLVMLRARIAAKAFPPPPPPRGMAKADLSLTVKRILGRDIVHHGKLKLLQVPWRSGGAVTSGRRRVCPGKETPPKFAVNSQKKVILRERECLDSARV